MSSPAVNVHLRSSLVAQEPLKVRSPIYGLFRGLAPPDQSCSLADALIPLIEAIQSGQVVDLSVHDLRMAIVHCHNNGVDVKQFQEVANPSSLTVAGIAAINLYTGEFVSPQFYSVLNTALRDANREKCKPFVPYIWLLMHALRDCPLHPKKVVFRGVKADLSAHYPKDREITWFQFSSCTCDLSVEQSEQFCGSTGVRTLFTIELTTGRARLITQYSLVESEAEVLLPPNSRFKVKGVFDAGNGLIQIQLEELPCLEPILDFDAPFVASADVSPVHIVASGGSVAAASPVQGEDPEVLALSQSLKALGVGTAVACFNFAKSLADQGVLSLNRLKKLQEADTREILEVCGMKKLQVLTVLEAIALPASSAPSLPPTLILSPPAPDIASAPAPVPFNESPTCVATLAHVEPVNYVVFHPTAPLLATSVGIDNVDRSAVTLWRLSSDNSSATRVATLAGHTKICSIAFHPSAPLLATGSFDGTMMLWRLSSDNSSATWLATLAGQYVAFHPTAPLVATSDYKCFFEANISKEVCTVKLWELSSDHSSATCVATLAGHSRRINSVAFHPSAPLLATGGYHNTSDGTVKLWRLSSGNLSATCVATLEHSGPVYSVTFHPTAPILAAGGVDNTVKLWRLSSDHSSATCVATLAHSSNVYSIAFHPTAPPLATGSYPTTVRLFRLSSDCSSAICVATLAGHNKDVHSVAFHPTAPLLATGSNDCTVKLWR